MLVSGKGNLVSILLPVISYVLSPVKRKDRQGKDSTALLYASSKKGHKARSSPGLYSVYQCPEYVGGLSVFSFTNLFYRKNDRLRTTPSRKRKSAIRPAIITIMLHLSKVPP